MTPLTRRNLLFSLTSAVMVPAAARAERRLPGEEYFELTHRELRVPGLDPAHDGLTVAHLTDLHIGRDVPDTRILAALEAVNAAKPDLVALTGDFVTSQRDDYDHVPYLLGRLERPAFAVLGNHDHWSDAAAIRARLEAMNVTVLQNAHTVTRVRGVDFTVLGMDDDTAKHADPDATYKGSQAGSRLVLTHTPAGAAKLPHGTRDLVLSGHTHGGQWNVPGLTQGVFLGVGHRWFRGMYRVRDNMLYVNRGLGFGRGTRLPRIDSEPEVALFTLRPLEA